MNGRVGLGLALACAVMAPVFAAVMAVPPADAPAFPARFVVAQETPLPSIAARAILLPAPDAVERARLVARNTAGTPLHDPRARALAVGMGRSMPAGLQVLALAGSDWIVGPDGTRRVRIDIQSPEAQAVRVAIALAAPDAAVTLRFAGSETPAVFGFAATEVTGATTREGSFWSPVLAGSTASIEIAVSPERHVRELELRIVGISHIEVGPLSGLRPDARAATTIGLSDACEVDVACVVNAPAALVATARSVAKMIFTKRDGTTYQCTGTLLNDAPSSLTPYFYTASHCVDEQYAAANLNTYWFFDAVSCNSRAVPPFVQRVGGADLLARSSEFDWSLLRLREPPPSGAKYSAWRAAPLALGDFAATMHHPEGDLKKWTQGQMAGLYPLEQGGSYTAMYWLQGATEPGSSGGGLFTYQPAAAYYELRGGLWGGFTSCTSSFGIDFFSRLDKALPLMREYLAPNAAGADALVPVIEYYHPINGHYFMTADSAEIADLDGGAHPGWERTGLRFLAYSQSALAPPGVSPVCRFYRSPGQGDSHFFSADPAECAATAARFGNAWIFETAAAFWIPLPDRTTGTCPANTRPVYRFFNAPRTSHRYTTEADQRARLAISPGWTAEGYGTSGVVMCSPSPQ